jgi:hypothetical protein
VAISRPSVASQAPDGTAANRRESGEFYRQPIEGPTDVGKSHVAQEASANIVRAKNGGSIMRKRTSESTGTMAVT